MHKVLVSIITIFLCMTTHSKDTTDMFKVGGYLMIDHDYYPPFYQKENGEYSQTTEIRRSKLSLTSQPLDYVKAKIQLKYTNRLPGEGKFFPGDVFIRLNKNDYVLQLGRMKETFGLEQQTSSAELIAIERSLPTSIFSPGRSAGIQLKKNWNHKYFATGYYINRNNDYDFALANLDLTEKDNEDEEAITMRISLGFKQDEHSTLHIGSTFSKRWFDKKLQYKSKAEVHSADTIVRSARFYASDSLIYQLDWAIHRRQFLIQGELFANKLQQIDGYSWLYTGAYIQASYRLFGDYKYKGGIFKSRKSKTSPVFEWVFRQSYVDLRDNQVGSEAAASSLGMNIHISSIFKIMANMTIPWISGDTVNQQEIDTAYSLRAQVSF